MTRISSLLFGFIRHIRLYFLRNFIAKQIEQVRVPLLSAPIMFEVLIVVDPVGLLVRRILPLLEVDWFMLNFVNLAVLPDGPLSLF